MHCQCLLSHARLSAEPEDSWGRSLSLSMVSYPLLFLKIVRIAFSHEGPQEPTIGKITVFQKLFISPGFLSWTGVLFVAALAIVFYFAPRSVLNCSVFITIEEFCIVRYGKKSMLWYIFVCSMIGGISVSVTTGLGAAIVETARGDNQVRHSCPVI